MPHTGSRTPTLAPLVPACWWGSLCAASGEVIICLRIDRFLLARVGTQCLSVSFTSCQSRVPNWLSADLHPLTISTQGPRCRLHGVDQELGLRPGPICATMRRAELGLGDLAFQGSGRSEGPRSVLPRGP